MKYVLCSVRDVAANCFGQPFSTVTVETGIRMFRDSVNNPDPSNVMRNHAVDFELYHLGEFDDATATFHPLQLPVRIALGRDLLRPVAPLPGSAG